MKEFTHGRLCLACVLRSVILEVAFVYVVEVFSGSAATYFEVSSWVGNPYRIWGAMLPLVRQFGNECVGSLTP